MARVFTIEFESYNQKPGRAIVILHAPAPQSSVRIRFFDEDIIHVFGKDSIEFEGLTGYKKLYKAKEHPRQLLVLDRINKVIAAHLLQ